jgi:hypothetical protein
MVLAGRRVALERLGRPVDRREREQSSLAPDH